MAIDPMLYEKVTGRSADPTRRLGEALAQSAGPGKGRSADASDSGSPAAIGLMGPRLHWWLSIGDRSPC